MTAFELDHIDITVIVGVLLGWGIVAAGMRAAAAAREKVFLRSPLQKAQDRCVQSCHFVSQKRHIRFIPPFLTMTTQSCLVCGAPSTKLCPSCKTAPYCGREHQKKVGSKNYTPSADVPICFACRTSGRIKSTAARSRRLVPTPSMPSSSPRMKPSLVSLRFLGS
jgi:hypothetical protein